MSVRMLLATLDIEKLPAGSEDLLTFIIRLWQGQGLVRGTIQGLCLDVGEMPHVAFMGAGVGGVAAGEAYHRTMTHRWLLLASEATKVIASATRANTSVCRPKWSSAISRISSVLYCIPPTLHSLC